MEQSVELTFSKRPNGLWVPLMALFGMRRKFDSEKPLINISAKWVRIKVNEKHVAKFNQLCGLSSENTVSIFFPFTLVYPLLQRILVQKDAPLSLFQVLNSRIQVVQHGIIDINKRQNIYSRTCGRRVRPKGLELDILSVIEIDGRPVWENIQTFYYRGQFGKPDETYKPRTFSPIIDAKPIGQWYLSEGNGFRFARVSGDGNGIHYSRRYAQLLGFERDFAQPLMVLAKVAEYLLDNDHGKSVYMDVMLKGQLYYNRDITLLGAINDDGMRFDVYSEGNPLPCIMGLIRYK